MTRLVRFALALTLAAGVTAAAATVAGSVPLSKTGDAIVTALGGQSAFTDTSVKTYSSNNKVKAVLPSVVTPPSDGGVTVQATPNGITGTMAINRGDPYSASPAVTIDSTVTGATRMRVSGDIPWKAVSLYTHGLGIRGDGTLWSWGAGYAGGLGTGSTQDATTPAQVGTVSTWTTVSAGGNYSLALRSDGSMWGWGRNNVGQIGDGTGSDRSTPVQVDGGYTWKAVAAAEQNWSMAIRSDGTLWGWGANGAGQLGIGTTSTAQFAKVQVQPGTTWLAVAAGSDHTLALRSDRTLWAWGGNGSGQLGQNNKTASLSPVQIGTDNTWTAIATGSWSSYGLKSDGTLWACGNGGMYQLGNGGFADKLVMTQASGGAVYRSISARVYTAAATRSNGSLATWGNNQFGEAGGGAPTYVTTPTTVTPAGTDWQGASVGFFSLAALKGPATLCDLYTTGTNTAGQLCDGTKTSHSLLAPVYPGTTWSAYTQSVTAALGATPGAKSLTAIYTDESANYTSITDSITLEYPEYSINNGAAYATNTTISLDSTTNAAAYMKVTPPFKQVVTSGSFTAGIGLDGSLWAAGDNGSGQLGLGYPGTSEYAWKRVGTATDWKAVAAGYSHMLALKTDGTLWGAGQNYYSQLGTAYASVDGTGTLIRVAPAISDFTTITAGDYYSMALRASGAAYAWGQNSNYQCGATSPDPQPVPTPVAGGRTFVAIDAGQNLSLGMEAGGDVYQWGLVNGVNTATPAKVNLGTELARQIDAGYQSGFALTRTGALYGWGYNGNGQLGIGNYTTTWTPTQVAGGRTDWKQIATGCYHTSAVTTGGALYVWGDGSGWGLGRGMYETTSTPMRLGTSDAWSSVSVGYSANAALQGDVLWGWGSSDGLCLGNWGMYARVPTLIGTDWTPYAQHVPFKVGTYDTTYSVPVCFRTPSGLTYTAGDDIYVDSQPPYGSITINNNAAYTTTRTVTVSAGVSQATLMRIDGGAWVPFAWSTTATLSAGDGVKTVTVDFKDQAEQMLTLSDTIVLDTTPPSGTMTLNNGVETTTGVKVRMQLNVSPDTAWMSVNSPGWKQVSIGGSHTLGIRNDGTLWAWGFNGNGELGIGNNTDKSVPTQVGTASDWVAVSAGQNISAGIRAGGTLWTWGAGGSYALGTGNTSSRNTPGQIATSYSWKTVVAASSYMLAIRSNDEMWGWGYGAYGQLGNGNNSSITLPMRSGTGYWREIAAQGYSAAGISTSGALYCWGVNEYGQVGDNTISQHYTPTQPTGGGSWLAVAAGGVHTVAIKADGSLWSWGNDYSGNNSRVPVRMLSGQTFDQVTSCYGASWARRVSDGTWWRWGYNGSAGLGDGTTTDKQTPTQLPGSQWTKVYGGHTTLGTFATKSDNSLWTWGYNNGQFGDGAPAGSYAYTPQATDFKPYASDSQVILSSGEGVKTITAWLRDGAGLVGSVSATVGLDSLPPTTTATGFPSSGWATSTVTVSLDATDMATGVAWTKYRMAGGALTTYTAPFAAVEGSSTLEFFSRDNAGLVETTKTATVRWDGTAPVTGIKGGETWQDQTVELLATDAHSGVANTYYSIDGGYWYWWDPNWIMNWGDPIYVGEGQHTIDMYSVDTAGNREPTRTVTFTCDTGYPSTTISGVPVSWSNEITVTLTATDTLSGAKATKYQWQGGTVETYTAPFRVTIEGARTLLYWSIDNAGNTGWQEARTVYFDVTKPSSSWDYDGTWRAKPATITLTATDTAPPAGSGSTTLRYRIDGGAVTTYTGPFADSVEGTSALEWWATDAAGNAETAHTGKVYVDRTPPITTASGLPYGTVGGTVVVKLAATDGGAGLADTWYRINGVGPSHYLPSYSGIPISETGTTTLTYWSTDVLGNREATKTATIRIDPAAAGKGGADANQPCFRCHDSVLGKPNVPKKVDFAGGSVDYGLCRACHWVGVHPAHGYDTDCQACHKTYPVRTDYVSGKTATAYGYFTGSGSPSLSADVIHAAHANGSWPQTATAAPASCASCHAAAACDACHAGGLPHGQHAYASAPATYPMVTYTAAYGAPEGDPSGELTTPYTDTCVTSPCHLKGEAKGAVGITQYEENGPAVTRYGMWSAGANTSAYASYVLNSTTAGSALTYTVSGPGEVRLFGRASYVAGIVAVSVDGAPAVDADTYAPTSQYRTLLYSATLGEGTHTLRVTVTGRKNASSTGVGVCLDAAQVVVKRPASGDFIPVCVGCHPTKDSAAGHGYAAIDHVGDDTDTIEPLGRQTCVSCHSMDLMTEHNKERSSSRGRACAACHPNPRKTLGVWDQSCSQAGCHGEESYIAVHGSMAASHTVTVAIANSCTLNCHKTDIALEHKSHGIACTACHYPGYDTIFGGPGWNHSCTACHLGQHSQIYKSNNDCFECHGSSSAGMSWIGTPSAYANTAGNHQPGYATSVHGSAVPVGLNAPAVNSYRQCDACHTHSMIADGVATDFRGDGGAPEDEQRENLCYRCHARTANGGEETRSAGALPYTWNGRDIAAEFARASTHPMTVGGSSSAASEERIAFAQTTPAELGTGSKWQTAQTAAGITLQSGSWTYTPPARRSMYLRSGYYYEDYDVSFFDRMDLDDFDWNSDGYGPPAPAYQGGYGHNMITLNGVPIYTPGHGQSNHLRYTPGNGSVNGAWTALAPTPRILQVAGDATEDNVNGRAYYMVGGDTSYIMKWRSADDTWLPEIQAQNPSGSNLTFHYGSGIAYAPGVDKLFVVERGSGNAARGQLLSLSAPWSRSGPTTFTVAGQISDYHGPSLTEAGNLTYFVKNGVEYLAFVGHDPSSGSPRLAIVSNLSAPTPTITSAGSGGSRLNLQWDGADRLWFFQGEPTYVTIPDAVTSWSAWGSAQSVSNWYGNHGTFGQAAFTTSTPKPYAVTYPAAGTIYADVAAPAGATTWGKFDWRRDVPSRTALTMSVQGWNGSAWVALPGVDATSVSPIDLSSVSATAYTKLRLTASFGTALQSSATATLRNWSVTAHFPIAKGDRSTVACASCHNAHRVVKGGTAAWDVSRVSNPANTTTTVSSTTAFCLGCHTATPPAEVRSLTKLVPYGITMTGLGTDALFPGWAKDSSGTAFVQSAHYGTNGVKALCENCHDPHGSNNAELTAWTRPSTFAGSGLAGTRDNTSTAAFEQNLCYRCHGNWSLGQQAGYNGVWADNIASQANAGVYRHPIGEVSGKHSDTETVADNVNRHAECADCHNPHSARQGTHTANFSSAAPALRGAVGVKPVYDSTDRFSAAATYTAVTVQGPSDTEAMVCMKCHNGVSNLAVVTRSNGTTYVPTDLSREFNPNNLGFHNVIGDPTGGVKEIFTATNKYNGVSSTVYWPLDETFKNGWTETSQMTCTDCHSAVSSGAKGPHGSSAEWMVDPAYTANWSAARMTDGYDGGGNYWMGPDRAIVCDKCHSYRNFVHNSPSAHEVACAACHIRIPHGWKRPRLLAYTSDPAPYNAGTAINGVRITDHPNGTWDYYDCNTNCGHGYGGSGLP